MAGQQPLQMAGGSIQWETGDVRYLGTYLDPAMSWRVHRRLVVNTMRGKLQRLVTGGILSGNRTSVRIAREYVFQHIMGHANFCAPAFQFTEWQDVDDIQVSAARTLLNLPRWTSRRRTITCLGWLTVSEFLEWQRIKWYCHVLLMPATRWPRIALLERLHYWRGSSVTQPNSLVHSVSRSLENIPSLHTLLPSPQVHDTIAQ